MIQHIFLAATGKSPYNTAVNGKDAATIK